MGFGSSGIQINVTKARLKEDLENWCEYFNAWRSSEVSYGYSFVKPQKRSKLFKDWDKICNAKSRILKKYKLLSSMLAIHNHIRN